MKRKHWNSWKSGERYRDTMLHHYVNRKSRPDRNYLWRGAMAAQGIQPDEMRHHIAKDKDDYPDVSTLCEAASADGFPEFFDYHKESPHPYIGFGHLVCSWSVMRMWREIGEGTERAAAWLDDYALRVPVQQLNRLVTRLKPDILLLAWHRRDALFHDDKYELGRKWDVPYTLSRTSPDIYTGAMGASDWAMVLSPGGARQLLSYMASEPRLNTECTVAGLYADWRPPRLYSVTANSPRSHGLKPIFGNRWVLELSAYTDGNRSDLVGLHEGTANGINTASA